MLCTLNRDRLLESKDFGLLQHTTAHTGWYRYWIGEYTPGLKYNSDGSLVYIQPQSPGQAKQNNWLPIPTSNQPFNLNFRMYWPDLQVVNGTWTPPPIHSANTTG